MTVIFMEQPHVRTLDISVLTITGDVLVRRMPCPARRLVVNIVCKSGDSNPKHICQVDDVQLRIVVHSQTIIASEKV